MTTLQYETVIQVGGYRHPKDVPAALTVKTATVSFYEPLDLVGGILALLHKGFTVTASIRHPGQDGNEAQVLASRATILDSSNFDYWVGLIVEPFDGRINLGCEYTDEPVQ